MALREVAAREWPVGSTIRLITAIEPLMSVSFAFSSLDPARRLAEKEGIDARALANRMNQVAAEKLRDTGVAVSSLVREGNPKQFLSKRPNAGKPIVSSWAREACVESIASS